MSDLTPSAAGEDESDGSSPTLREFTAASNEVHMLATLTAAMIKAHTSAAPCAPPGRQELSSQLKYARTKQETDAALIKELEAENVRLKNLVDSAGEVSDAAAASLRELARSRRTVDDLRQEADVLQRRAQEAELRCEQLQQLLRDTEQRLSEAEQRAAASARVQHVERASARMEQALEASNERFQSAERRAARAEQIAAQEQARASDACQRASRAEAAAAEDHERALDAERRATRAEHLLEQLQEQTQELERQVGRAQQLAGSEAGRIADAERRVARAEQAAAQERERALAADRRMEEELKQARTAAMAANQRAALAEDAVDEERARADAAERRAARAEQAAEEAHQFCLDADRKATRAAQALEEAERLAGRSEQAHAEALARAEEAERRATRAAQSLEAAEARALDAERRAGKAEQAQQEALARIAESDRRAVRAEHAQGETVADLERCLVRAEQAAMDARTHANEMEKRAVRAEQAAQQDRQSVSDAERHVARMQQALEQAQNDVATAQRRAARAEQAIEEARARAEEARAQATQAESKAAHVEQLLAQERERAEDEARHAARMEAASLQDQERAREAEERAAAAITRAQQAETRLAVAEGHTAALETRLQQALMYADAADARAVDAERRYDRLSADSRELHAAVLHLANNPDIAALAAPPKSRVQSSQERDRSPRRLPWHSTMGRPRRTQDNDPTDQALDMGSPRRSALGESDSCKRSGFDTDVMGEASTPGLIGQGNSTLIRLWADAYATPSPDPGPTGRDAQKGSARWRAAPSRISSDQVRSSDGGQGSRAGGSPSRLAQSTGPLELFIDGTSALADELRHVRSELRSTRHELHDVKARYSAACSRVQVLEEQAANADKLKAKVEQLTVQARKCEHLAAELKVCRTQLAEVEGLHIDLRKAQAELAEMQGLRITLEEARAQLVEMDRVRSEARRVNALLQTVTRERDAARSELQEASVQAMSIAALKAQLQRLETSLAEVDQGREEARAAHAAAIGQQEKLRAQLLTAEEELGEAVRRCARLQAVADEVSHQRDRLQVALEGAEGALQAAEAERAVLAAAQERAKGKLQELAELQDEVRVLKSQLQEATAMQKRSVQGEEQANARVEESQKQIATLKAQLAQASGTQAEAAALKLKLDQALGQLQTMKADLSAAADRLEGHAQLQADHAATVERAERAEAQLRSANEANTRTNEQVQLLQQELAEARRGLLKTKEDLASSTALATSRGNRAAELEHEVAILREKSYQLEVEVASMTTELQRLKADLASASNMIEEATSERNQLSKQLSEMTMQHARSTAAATAAEERIKADLQQLQVRLATSEAEYRTLQHSNGNLHDELERTRGEVLTLQSQVKDEHRRREEHANECRRLQRELETTTEAMTQAQRSHRTAVAATTELEQDLERLRTGHSALEAELQIANARVQRLLEDTRQLTDRNAELSQQLDNMSATVRQIEAENARLVDGHASLTVEMEVRAAEARAARGEAAELAADRARLMAELHAIKAELEKYQRKGSPVPLAGLTQSGRSGFSTHGPSFSVDPRVTIGGGGIPPVPDTGAGTDSARPLHVARQLADEFASLVPSPNGRSDNLQALLAAPLDTGKLVVMRSYEALLAALDEEAQQLDEELAGKEASSSVLLQRMRATKQAITARMETLQAALQSARDAESDMRRQAADKDATIQRLQLQLAQLSGGATFMGAPNMPSAEPTAPSGPGGAQSTLGFSPGVMQGNTVISALRQDLDAAHERLRDAGRQLREAQQRAESAEAEVSKHRTALTDAQTKIAKLQTELTANDRVLAEAEAALVALVGEKESLEQKLDRAEAAEIQAKETAEKLRVQVAALQARLGALTTTAAAVEADAPKGASQGHATQDVQSRGDNASTSPLFGGSRGPLNRTSPEAGPPSASSEFAAGSQPTAIPALVPGLKLHKLQVPRTSESGSPRSTLQRGNTAHGAQPEGNSREGASEHHKSTGFNESATEVNGLNLPTAMHPTALGTGSTSSRYALGGHMETPNLLVEAAAADLAAMASLQRRYTGASMSDHLRRFSSRFSVWLPQCANQQPTSPSQSQDVATSVYMARPAASSVANAALQVASYRLTSGSSLASPRRTPSELSIRAINSEDFQAQSPAVSPSSAKGSAGPVVSPRNTIVLRSLSRAVEQVTQGMTMPTQRGVHGRDFENVTESGYSGGESPRGDARRSEAANASRNASSPLAVLHGGMPNPLEQATAAGATNTPKPGTAWPREDVPSSQTDAGSANPVAGRPVQDASAGGNQHHPVLSRTAVNQSARLRGESIWTGVGEVVAAGTYDFGQRPATVALRPNSSSDGKTLQQQAVSREVTPASLRRSAGLDESASMLARRLAAMDDALRAIGAA
ncbi:hypothetical protein VOLCADRAFT_116118 [Volvox carteri f. nagariensis]|uniref:Uncharacterized protein n=1 Tax=Volvox carteri f. nagariensis TaxID=3068 RepID=D8TKN1_VOLCA|nr:uncharacterized protein VOLCADRAFT_116118 [Volvox carteri f. nagariensis]EFJ51914.1 hypothetical protein VOLCADRAFT_116118 [Volvox carteri f. nagariensis]|eukprot:XP_002946688.1 hypothetical protein VOLCADRAFT_116118 [Volvox carteri f. nagariensis]